MLDRDPTLSEITSYPARMSRVRLTLECLVWFLVGESCVPALLVVLHALLF